LTKKINKNKFTSYVTICVNVIIALVNLHQAEEENRTVVTVYSQGQAR